MAKPDRRGPSNQSALFGLLVVGGFIALWWLSKSCFLSTRLYDSLGWLIPVVSTVLFFLWFTLLIYTSYKRNFVIPSSIGDGHSSVVRALGYAGMAGLLLGLVSFVLVYVGMMSVVYATSWHPIKFTASVRIRRGHGGRSCEAYLTFYNPPLERDTTTCSDYWSTDVLVFRGNFLIDEKVGPLGAKLVEIRHAQN
jgi:hypothetical protein